MARTPLLVDAEVKPDKDTFTVLGGLRWSNPMIPHNVTLTDSLCKETIEMTTSKTNMNDGSALILKGLFLFVLNLKIV